jgi:homopolymeric O-antigen transport system permease protein
LRGVDTSTTVRIQSSRGLFNLDLAAIWEFKELLYFFVWRNVKVRYKQTIIGSAWAIIQPLTTMIIFTVIFGRFAKIPSDGLPYSIFAYSALLPWNYFSQAVSRSSDSLISNTNLVRKVYFPRLIILVAEVTSPLVDFFISFLALVVMMVWFGIVPGRTVLALPLFLLLALTTALAMGLWLSALNARYRDVGHIVPFLVQIWMYASPVAYPVSLIPEQWRLLYSLNPMVGVIEGFRWTLLGKEAPAFGVIAVSATVVVALLFGGIIFFKRMEQTFADVI